ncbi:MAG: DUF481 domain-containing protein [Sedimentisphaerales bacterium]|nr:DUF481 domain-containing protein [Sedimentisphaerales bacterium]
MFKKILVSTLLTALPQFVLADTVRFENGETLTGTLVSLENGSLTFESANAGKVTVDQTSVTELQLDTPAAVQDKDGNIVTRTGKLSNGIFITDDKTTILADDITAINPAPPALPKFSGNITAGVSSSRGNTYAESGSISAELSYETVKSITVADMTYAGARSRRDSDGSKYTTEEYLTSGAKHERDINPKNYAFIDGRYKTDHIANLDRRMIGTLGLGHRFVNNDVFNLNGDLGISQLHEVYTVDEQTDTTDSLSARLAYNLDWVISEKLVFKNNLEYYPSTEDISDYYMSAKAELKYRFNGSIYGSFKTIFDYDSEPAEGNNTTDMKYIAGLGVDF